MAYVYDFVVLLVWTGICALLVSALERILELLGYRAMPVDEEPNQQTSPPAEG